jgi:hypothetical protein
MVYRIGEQKTPKPFVAACGRSIYTENLVHSNEHVLRAVSIRAPGIWSPTKKDQNDGHIANRLRPSVEAASDDDRWARLSAVGQLLTERYPDFDSRGYGYHKFKWVVSASPLSETSRWSLAKSLSIVIYIHNRGWKS